MGLSPFKCRSWRHFSKSSQGKNVDIWLESTRTVSDEDAALIQKNLGGYLRIANFSLTPYSQVEDEAPVKYAYF